MINKSKIISEIKHYYGEPLDSEGRFSTYQIDLAFNTALTKFFTYCPVILTKKVNIEAALWGLNKIELITDFSGNPIKADYRITGDKIILINPSTAIIHYRYSGNFSLESFEEIIKYTEGLNHIAEASIMYFMISYLELLEKNLNNTIFEKEAIRLASMCKQEKIVIRWEQWH